MIRGLCLASALFGCAPDFEAGVERGVFVSSAGVHNRPAVDAELSEIARKIETGERQVRLVHELRSGPHESKRVLRAVCDARRGCQLEEGVEVAPADAVEEEAVRRLRRDDFACRA